MLKLALKTNNGSTEQKNVKAYLGRISMHKANMFKIGQRVLTVKGIGTIIDSDRGEIITSLRGKDGMSHQLKRRDKKENLTQYYIYNRELQKMFPLSFCDYDYILPQGQPVVYRITNRGFAKLIPSEKEYYGFAKAVNRTKGGLKIYEEMLKHGHELKKVDSSTIK